ncbi:hypothetical protein BGZ98_003628, partial [Dissophora globulifera]
MQTSAEFTDHYSPSSSSSLTIIASPPPSYPSAHLPSKQKSFLKFGGEASGHPHPRHLRNDRNSNNTPSYGYYSNNNNNSSSNNSSNSYHTDSSYSSPPTSPESLTGPDKDQA